LPPISSLEKSFLKKNPNSRQFLLAKEAFEKNLMIV